MLLLLRRSCWHCLGLVVRCCGKPRVGSGEKGIFVSMSGIMTVGENKKGVRSTEQDEGASVASGTVAPMVAVERAEKAVALGSGEGVAAPVERTAKEGVVKEGTEATVERTEKIEVAGGRPGAGCASDSSSRWLVTSFREVGQWTRRTWEVLVRARRGGSWM